MLGVQMRPRNLQVLDRCGAEMSALHWSEGVRRGKISGKPRLNPVSPVFLRFAVCVRAPARAWLRPSRAGDDVLLGWLGRSVPSVIGAENS